MVVGLPLLREPSAPSVEAVAREAGLHPGLVVRLVHLGLVLDADAAQTAARVVRLHRDLAVNYAGALLASELLARIDALEARLGRYERR
jgi:hypothetical protein